MQKSQSQVQILIKYLLYMYCVTASKRMKKEEEIIMVKSAESIKESKQKAKKKIVKKRLKHDRQKPMPMTKESLQEKGKLNRQSFVKHMYSHRS